MRAIVLRAFLPVRARRDSLCETFGDWILEVSPRGIPTAEGRAGVYFSAVFQGGACERWSRVLRQGFSRTIKVAPEQ